MKFIIQEDLVIYESTGELIFNLKELPSSIQLNRYTFIYDVKSFVISHINSVNTYGYSQIGLAYFNRLEELQNLLYEQQGCSANIQA